MPLPNATPTAVDLSDADNRSETVLQKMERLGDQLPQSPSPVFMEGDESLSPRSRQIFERTLSSSNFSFLKARRTESNQKLVDQSPVNLAHELSLTNEKIRWMQYEFSKLKRQLRSIEEDSDQWSLRYSRRMVILSNILLGFWISIVRFSQTLRTRTRLSGFLGHLLFRRSAGQKQNEIVPLSEVIVSGLVVGSLDSFVFFTSALLYVRGSAWKRNFAFVLSTAYSCFLVAVPGRRKNPRAANYVNVFLNALYIVARFYYLHGLLSFHSTRFL